MSKANPQPPADASDADQGRTTPASPSAAEDADAGEVAAEHESVQDLTGLNCPIPQSRRFYDIAVENLPQTVTLSVSGRSNTAFLQALPGQRADDP